MGERAFYRVVAWCLIAGQVAWAGPQGGVVVGGSASIEHGGTLTTVHQQSDRAIVNWSSFSTAAQETVRFQQPGASAVVLNRVVGNSASELNGALQANGRVFLLNRNGVVFGAGSRVQVGGLVASTLDMTDADFMAGRHQLRGSGGAVINRGTITAAPGGSVALIGGVVSNEGVIEAPGGRVALAAGLQAVVNLDGGQLVNVAVPATPGDVQAPAALVSDALRRVVNDDGLVVAGQVREVDGVVTLGGAEGLAVNSGTVRTNGAPGQAAGSIRVEGAAAVLTESARLHADGVGANSRGGDVRVLGRRVAANAAGSLISARGGSSGDGGFAEVSGAKIAMNGAFDLMAERGRAGDILIDPVNIVILNGSCANAGDNVFVGSVNTALAGGNVTIQADNSITFQNTQNITNGGNGNSLTFRVTGAGGIQVCDAVATHGSISITGPGATLTFCAGTGAIDLFDAPCQGGTSFIATNVSVLATGSIIFANAEATNQFVARSTCGDLFGAVQSVIRGDNLLSLRSKGHIARTDLNPLAVNGTGTLIADNRDFANSGAPGSERVIRLTGQATTFSALNIDTSIQTNGLSVLDIRGAGCASLLRHNAGVLSGTGLSGTGTVDYTNSGTASFTVNGLTAGTVLLSAGGDVVLQNASGNGAGAAGDLVVTGGTVTVANGTIGASDLVGLTAGAGDVTSTQTAGNRILAGRVVANAACGSVGQAGNPLRAQAGVFCASAAGTVEAELTGTTTVGSLVGAGVNLTGTGNWTLNAVSAVTLQTATSGSVTNAGTVQASTSMTIGAASVGGAGTFTAPSVTFEACGIGTSGQRVNVDADSLALNPSGTKAGDIFVQIANGGANTNLTAARTTSGEIDVLQTNGSLTTTGLVQANDGAADHVVKLATTGGHSIVLNSTIRSITNSGDVVVDASGSVTGSGSISGQTVTLVSRQNAGRIGASGDPLDVDPAVLVATLTGLNSDLFLSDGGADFALASAAFTVNTSDFSAAGSQLSLVGSKSFSSNPCGVLSGTLPATFAFTNTGGGFTVGTLCGFATSAVFTASTAIEGSAGTIAGTVAGAAIGLHATSGVGAATPVRVGQGQLTVTNASGEVDIAQVQNGGFEITNGGGDVTVTQSAGGTVRPAGVSSASGNVLIRNLSVVQTLDVAGRTVSAPNGSVTLDSDHRLGNGGTGGTVIAGTQATLKANDQGVVNFTITAPIVEFEAASVVSFLPGSNMEIRTICTGIGLQLTVDACGLSHDITIGNITTGGATTINAGLGRIFGSAGRLTTGSSIFLEAAGSIGSAVTPVKVDVSGAPGVNLSLTSTGGDVFVSELDDMFFVGGVAGTGRTFHVDAGCTIFTASISAPSGTIELISGSSAQCVDGGP